MVELLMLKTERTDECYCDNCQCETSHDVINIDSYEGKGYHSETWTCNCCREEN